MSRTFGLLLMITGGVLIYWALKPDVVTSTSKDKPKSTTSGSGRSLVR